MYKLNWKLFLEDILESIELIESYIADINFDNFKNDRKTIDAVVRNLEIIGETTNNIPVIVKNKYVDIDWKGMIGLRNRIAHGYFGINLTIIWEIIKKELPFLKDKMQQILGKE